MSGNFSIILTIYHECPFAVEVGERFVAQKKRGDRGNAFKVINHGYFFASTVSTNCAH